MDLDRLTSYDDFRKIIHIDMDAFYASVEQRDNPALRGKPIAVGGDGKRGVTTTASYEARKFGVKSAMPGWRAKELCPDLIFVKLRFDAYKEASRQIRSVFEDYTSIYEPLSLDEAYLDVTVNNKKIKYATDVAMDIKKAIFEKTGLTASAGVSYCKFLAKMASDYRKPDGITVITPRKAADFIASLAIEKFYGVGKVTAEKMKSLNIHNGLDLLGWEENKLIQHFGKAGAFYYKIARGIDDRPVESNRERKSIAVERTYDEIIDDMDDIKIKVEYIAQKLHASVIKSNFHGKTITLKIKNKSFITKTRSHTAQDAFTSFDDIYSCALKLVESNQEICKALRLIGLTITNHNEVNKNQEDDSRFDTKFLDLFSGLSDDKYEF
jgi:DNA polymerase IV